MLDWETWRTATAGDREAAIADAARRVGGQVTQRSSGPCVTVRGRTMVLVPGGRVSLGWNGSPAQLTDAQRAAWAAGASAESFEALLRHALGPARQVDLAPMLVEIEPRSVGVFGEDEDPEEAVRAAVAAEGFRLPGSDEWENAARAGASTMFRWGDEWPDGTAHGGGTTFTGHRAPNALGLRFLDDPSRVEVVAERDWLRGGDGGVTACGGRPAPETWVTFALAFRHPRAAWQDVVDETFEQAYVRRALPLG